MAEETLRVVIDDAELDIALAKLRSAELLSNKAATGVKAATTLKKTVESSGVREFILNLPTINRAQRLLVTQLPMMREALQLTFRGKLLAAADPITMVLVLGVYLKQALDRMEKDIKRENIRLEDMIREGLNVTHREFEDLSTEQIGYATWWDQFKDTMDEEGFVKAVTDIIIAWAYGAVTVEGGGFMRGADRTIPGFEEVQ